MAERSPIIECEDVPLDEARRMSRGPWMNPEIYIALKQNIQSLDNVATRLTASEGTSTTTVKHRILRVDAELCIPLTIRKVPGGLIYSRSTDEDLQEATEVVEHLQVAPRPAHTARRGKRRPWPRATANTASIRTLMHGYHTCGCDLMMSDPIDPGSGDASVTQTQLDELVVTIELTLISIVQGVALSFLADQARDVLVSGQFSGWPYAVTGLLIILLFWSRSLIHTLTVIRWPLELGHNFMYIACTLVETVMFTQLTQPSR